MFNGRSMLTPSGMYAAAIGVIDRNPANAKPLCSTLDAVKMYEEPLMSRSPLRTLPFRFAAVTLLFSVFAVRPAHAVSKEMIQLQTQIQQLQDAVARLQQSNDERMGAMKDLLLQTADTVNKMSVEMNGLKLGMQNQQEAFGAKSDQLSGQVQSLNDSVDELKARMGRMEKVLGDIQGQQQSANAILNNMPAGGGALPSNNAPPSGPAPITRDNGGNNQPQQDQSQNQQPPTSPAAGGGPAVGDMYRTAYSDYMSAKYPLATSEFSDLVKAYAEDNLAGNAYFYLGEIAMRSQKPTLAVKNYDQVLEHYPDNAKVPAAHLHKGEALLSMKQTDSGTRELRALVQRFPNSPEAAQAKQRLAGLHTPAR
jgi:TolA-binding protein